MIRIGGKVVLNKKSPHFLTLAVVKYWIVEDMFYQKGYLAYKLSSHFHGKIYYAFSDTVDLLDDEVTEELQYPARDILSTSLEKELTDALKHNGLR